MSSPSQACGRASPGQGSVRDLVWNSRDLSRTLCEMCHPLPFWTLCLVRPSRAACGRLCPCVLKQLNTKEAPFKQFLSIFQLLAFVSPWGLSKLLMTSLLLLPTVPQFTLSATLDFLPKGEQYRGLSSESHACPGQEWTLGHWGS